MIISFTTFAAYTLIQKQNLDPATAFTALTLLHRLSNELGMIPMEFTHILQMKVSMDRIMEFLKETELDKYNESVALESKSNAVGFKDAKFMYHGSNTEEDITMGSSFNLHDMNVEFPIGKLTVICGSTGSGKTSLILSLLGELKTLVGESYLPDPREFSMSEPDLLTGTVPSGVAYAAQSSWMLNATVRDNILFGRPFDSDRYWKVIEACALTRDLETLDAGDMTEV